MGGSGVLLGAGVIVGETGVGEAVAVGEAVRVGRGEAVVRGTVGSAVDCGAQAVRSRQRMIANIIRE